MPVGDRLCRYRHERTRLRRFLVLRLGRGRCYRRPIGSNRDVAAERTVLGPVFELDGCRLFEVDVQAAVGTRRWRFLGEVVALGRGGVEVLGGK
ncbi:hypothetical protein, partial [Mycobacterium sp. NPDC006124]|uniref:hypothetical protein n=1 Tax=Mycobacterium sp. NPDC006124 TaxID=3156729 RepID=UPI0033ACBCFE